MLRAHSSPARPYPVARTGSSPHARHDLSAEALKLHVFAVLTTIYEGHPGVVRWRYLEGIADDLTDPVRELCAARLWASRPDRYVVPEAEVRRIAQIVHDQVRRPPPAR